MREAMGGTWFFQLIIIFVLLFSAYLALSINYSKAFKVKNEVLSFIEREEGLTNRTYPDEGALQLINNYLSNAGYGAMGTCEADWLGAPELNASSLEKVTDTKKRYFYCVNKKTILYDDATGNIPLKSYYEVRMFFKFDLPVLTNLFVFKIEGETNEIRHTADTKLWRNLRGWN